MTSVDLFIPPATQQWKSPQLLLQEHRKSLTLEGPLPRPAPQEPPLKLMATTEELTKGTTMMAMTRALLKEHSRSTHGKELSSACKALSWWRLEMGTHYCQFLTEQQPAKQFRVSVYFLLRPGEKKLFL